MQGNNMENIKGQCVYCDQPIFGRVTMVGANQMHPKCAETFDKEYAEHLENTEGE